MQIPDHTTSHRDLVARLARQEGWRCGAELGLGGGWLFERLLSDCPSLMLIGVDTFPRPDWLVRLRIIAARFAGRAELIQGTTHDAAAGVPNESLDFVFIDAEHSRAGVARDISRWRSKLRPGGWLMGHDYHPLRYPGVCRAVHEAFGTDIVVLPHTVWVRVKPV